MPRRPSRRRSAASSPFSAWVALIGIVAGFAVLLGWLGPRPPATPPPRRVPLGMAQARASNARVPIDRERRGRAAPVRFRGGPAEREQAAQCLATAALYEAGRDRAGQRAVMQVVLNRVRSPGFPATVCGVVYQGYARATGCQFSFTCDRSVERRPIHDGWGAALARARRALAGRVDARVGTATHYHADWTVPFWRDTLTKVARVGPHLFYVRGRRGR